MPPEPYVGSLGQKVSQVHMAGYQVEGGVVEGQPLMSQILIDSQLPPPLGFDISDNTSGWEPTGHLAVREGSMVSVACFLHCF